ncbi:cytochrome c biogenesis CcdA family protein [Thalassobacillus sp. CUG 92003]|uniref:cytochrome c biogenesis CcdA family protein n=1 Tax=Thalassobacillus sp. CUG 92003 TaxID=2736641 RepID=UPI0015E69F3D|nr:cytochrome c biogenesis protein CcdA [Thalassobacillus sp. CUG 92003]
METEITFLIAFGAGIISFLSPCTLPVFPAYLSYITGVSVKELQQRSSLKVRRKLLIHSIFFLFGLSSIFISLGLGASLIGSWIQDLLTGISGKFIQRIAGIFIIAMGLIIAGFLNFKWMMKDKRIGIQPKPSIGYLGTTFVGMGFAAGWTPCIGPIFASILALAASEPTQGFIYTLLYVLGFALPFLTFTFFIGSTRFIVKHSEFIMKTGGMLIIVMGLLLYTGQLTRLSNVILRLVQDTWLAKIGEIIVF